MKHLHYSALEELEQMEEVLETGVLLGTRSYGFHSISLYEVDGCYAEATFHSHFNVLLDITFFNDLDRLDPYLHTIDIERLLH